jgi:hypothetical protein
VAISEHFTVSKAQTLIEVQSLIEPLNRHFWVGAVEPTSYGRELNIPKNNLFL